MMTQPPLSRGKTRPMVQFTDDVDLTWRIDDDLRLHKVEELNPPWRGLLGGPDPLPASASTVRGRALRRHI